MSRHVNPSSTKATAQEVVEYGRHCERVTGLRPPQKPQSFVEWLREWRAVQSIEANEPSGPPVPGHWEVRNYRIAGAEYVMREALKVATPAKDQEEDMS